MQFLNHTNNVPQKLDAGIVLKLASFRLFAHFEVLWLTAVVVAVVDDGGEGGGVGVGTG